MKKLLLNLVGLLVALSPAVASRTAAMNVSDPSATISSRGVQAIYDIAAKEPGFRIWVEHAYGSPLVAGDLEVVNRFTVGRGKTFPNSGLDPNRMPVQHPTIAAEDTLFYTVRSKQTGKKVCFKNKCLNGSFVIVPEVPSTPTVCDTTWNFNEVDIRIQLSQTQNNNQQLTATASNGPISIVFNNTTQAAPLMNGGGNGANQFYVTRDSRGLLSLGYTVGGQMKVYGGAGGSATVGPITNNNANNLTAVNANNTVVNTGPGNASGTAIGTGSGTAKAGGG